MSETSIAYTLNGERALFPGQTKFFGVKRMKSRGAPETMWRNGAPVVVPAEIDYDGFREAVGGVAARYRLHALDASGKPIDCPAGYVQIDDEGGGTDSERGGRGGDDVLVQLMRAQVEAMRAQVDMVGRVVQANVDMTRSVSELIRAADGAGLCRREPLPPTPPAAKQNEGEDSDDDDSDDEDSDDEDNGNARPTVDNSIGAALKPLVDALVPVIVPFAESYLASLVMGGGVGSPRRKTAPPAAETPRATGPSQAPASPAPGPSARPRPPWSGTSPPVPPAAPAPSSGSQPAASSPSMAPTAAGPTASEPPTPAAARNDNAQLETAIADNHAIAPNAPNIATSEPTEPPPVVATTAAQPPGPDSTDIAAKMRHLQLIQGTLTPDEWQVCEAVLLQMPTEDQLAWRDRLLALPVPEAVDLIRNQLAKEIS